MWKELNELVNELHRMRAEKGLGENLDEHQHLRDGQRKNFAQIRRCHNQRNGKNIRMRVESDQ